MIIINVHVSHLADMLLSPRSDCVAIKPSRFAFDEDAARYLVALSEVITKTKLLVTTENNELEFRRADRAALYN